MQQMEYLRSLLMSFPPVKVIDAALDYKNYMPLDLSESNADLTAFDSGNAAAFEHYINRLLSESNAKVAYGGYCEQRSLYRRSSIFKNAQTEQRDIHIGLDLWAKAGTSVIAALDGHIHSFANNTGIGNYGPTILLEHHQANVKFYTLYGHLSLESLSGLEIGQRFRQGEILGYLGTASVNGDYAPHLHFQIIADIQHFVGDYPGVCSKSDLVFYRANCPDPNVLLKITPL